MNRFSQWHPTFPVNLSNCDDEPIHIPGAVQPFGILLGFDPDTDKLKVWSANAEELLQKNATELEKLALTDLINIQTKEDNFVLQKKKRHLLKMEIKGRAGIHFGVCYMSSDLAIYEIELTSDASVISDSRKYLMDLPTMMNDVFSHENVRSLMDFSAKRVKELTGFDRVMIYRYDENYDGEVVAEAKEERLEAFKGLHYPASDVPPQARILYLRNWTRIIPTIHYKPALLKPKAYERVDLSDSIIRSVSPIHLEYLENMGVGASMSISLIQDGKLWGLIACHHYSGEHHVPVDVRLGCEAYGQLISRAIQGLESDEALEASRKGEDKLQELVSKMSEENFLSHIYALKDRFLDLFQCSGMTIQLGDDQFSLGDTLPQDVLRMISDLLSDRSVFEPLVTHKAEEIFNDSAIDKKKYSGIMALSLSQKHNYYIICTRPEVKQKLNWAGNPNKKKGLATDADRLSPRGSFDLWEETHEGESIPWSNDTVSLFKKFGLLFVKIVIDRKELAEKSNKELHALNQAKDEFVATVSHELRTPLNSIIGWTELALSKELKQERVPEALKIIQRNARSQNQLIGDLLDVSRIISGKMKISVHSMRVSEIVEAVVLSFRPAAEAKDISIIAHTDEDSDTILGDPQRVQQVVWNLVSNAIKFSKKKSRIWVIVQRFNSQVELKVKDQGLGLSAEDLDRVFGRFEQVDTSMGRKAGGLGLGLAISKHIVELHGGKIWAESEGLGTGTTFTASFPISPLKPVVNQGLPIDDDLEEGVQVTSPEFLKGFNILIVEDEMDAQSFLQILLSSHGAKTHVASDGEEALRVLEDNTGIEIVLSDVGMPNMDGYELMKNIRKSDDHRIKNLCTIALTAFARPQDRINALKAGFDSYISKPVMQEELLTVLKSACVSRNRG